MKKIFILISVLAFVITASSCNGSVHIADAPSDAESLLSAEMPADVTFVEVDSIVQYMTFEESLAAATDIVIATYTGDYEQYGIYRHLSFVPERQLKGSEMDEVIHISLCDKSVSVADSDIAYKQCADDYTAGSKYVLVLAKRSSVYEPYDLYAPFNNVFIEFGKVATMYDGTALKNFSTEQIDSCEAEYVIDYIENFLLKGIDTSDKYKSNLIYIRSDDLTEVVNGSPVVVEVIPYKLTGGSENNNTESFMCSVKNVLKGDASESEIEIIFTAGTVKEGKQYIVMLGDYEGRKTKILSSKISVQDSESEAAEQIRNILKAGDNA